MKIVVREHKKVSPFISLYTAQNRLAKKMLGLLGKKYFDNTDLYVLSRRGFKIHTYRGKTL